MTIGNRGPGKTIIDLEMLNTLKTCPACHRSFSLGDPVVLACGAWEGPPRLIHEHEAVFDGKTSVFIERKCYDAARKR